MPDQNPTTTNQPSPQPPSSCCSRGSMSIAAYSASSSTRSPKPANSAPERARSCRNAITMASVMIDEIRLRAHARPLDSDDTA
jgi:hypothetical protein